jgi:hypothetical protein
MESLRHYLNLIPCPTIGEIFVVLIGFNLLPYIIKAIRSCFGAGRRKPKLINDKWEKDVVYLYQFPRGPLLPSVFPYPLKMETWLKANNIKHEVTHNYFLTAQTDLQVKSSWLTRSKDGLVPFIELNGEQMADSQLIIHKLQKYFNKDNGAYTPEQRALSRAIDRMVEGSLFL